ncbi:MAG: Tim44/TimA family putative adaptor protein [Pseudomonadota bacterium]|nr:Tim44/TimA family putative adaptor protein [Pseudomonadota bacterium]
MLQILILAAVAAFLFWRLSIVLGSRTGFEKATNTEVAKKSANSAPLGQKLDSDLDGDEDISDYLEIDSPSGEALVKMKKVEHDFSVRNFVTGAKQAYEMILMAYERGDLDTLEQYLSPDVYKDFEKVVMDRANKGYNVEANFIGIREIRIKTVDFDENDHLAEIVMFFKCELSSVVKNKDEKVIEGSLSKIKTHSDLWTFGRKMGTPDPSWRLIATD